MSNKRYNNNLLFCNCMNMLNIMNVVTENEIQQQLKNHIGCYFHTCTRVAIVVIFPLKKEHSVKFKF